MNDITSKEDIEFLMRSFYKEAINDQNIGVYFTKVVKLDLDEHLPHIVDFWELQLLRKGNYKKNVLQIHQNLNHKKEFEKVHFKTWLAIFNKTVDLYYKGDNANFIKTRALSIATVMQIKMG